MIVLLQHLFNIMNLVILHKNYYALVIYFFYKSNFKISQC